MHAPRSLVIAIHLGISATLMLVLLSVMLLWWYPAGLFTTGGGWAGLKILLPIDLVLGPALTWAFYRPGKPSARLDLAVIAAVQLLALGYGGYAVWSQHPRALVLVGGQFNALTPSDQRRAAAQLATDGRAVRDPRQLSDSHPPLVVARRFSGEAAHRYMNELFNDGLELTHRADRYQSLAAQANVAERSMDSSAARAAVGAAYTAGHWYFPLRTKHGGAVAEIDPASGALVRVHPPVSVDTPSAAALNLAP